MAPDDSTILVLLVEDDADQAFVIQRALKKEDPQLEVIHVGDLATALSKLKEGGIDSALDDLSLLGSVADCTRG